jgi:hypothetical protein
MAGYRGGVEDNNGCRGAPQRGLPVQRNHPAGSPAKENRNREPGGWDHAVRAPLEFGRSRNRTRIKKHLHRPESNDIPRMQRRPGGNGRGPNPGPPLAPKVGNPAPIPIAFNLAMPPRNLAMIQPEIRLRSPTQNKPPPPERKRPDRQPGKNREKW